MDDDHNVCAKHPHLVMGFHPKLMTDACVACWAESEQHTRCTEGPERCMACLFISRPPSWWNPRQVVESKDSIKPKVRGCPKCHSAQLGKMHMKSGDDHYNLFVCNDCLHETTSPIMVDANQPEPHQRLEVED